MPRPRIGLALGSGSARGWSHIGVIEVLAEAGIEPDIVCGCSIGAVVGAAYVAGEMPALKEFALSLTWREITRLIDVRLSGGGLVGGQEIVALLRRLKILSANRQLRETFCCGCNRSSHRSRNLAQRRTDRGGCPRVNLDTWDT